jgi:hypothetical protein
VLSRDLSVLQQFIDSADLPKEYGGQLDWQYGDPPLLDKAAQEAIGKVPTCPCWFKDGKVIRSSDAA